jgi:hypothetical protein
VLHGGQQFVSGLWNNYVWLRSVRQQNQQLRSELDRLAGMGFDWVWLLSVWQTGSAGRRISLENREWRREFIDTLPDLRDEDIGGSGFAITGYTVPARLGGDAALARLRKRLSRRGLKLMLDFVLSSTRGVCTDAGARYGEEPEPELNYRTRGWMRRIHGGVMITQ